MFARMFSWSVVLGLSALASLGFSPLSAAQAASPGWSAYAAQQRYPQFRPWSRADSRSLSVHRQSQARTFVSRAVKQSTNRRASSAPLNRKGQQPVFSSNRAGARKAVPVTRGQELGLRFRPDERESPYGQGVAPQGNVGTQGYASELHSQFRPRQPRRKPTYEELQAESASRERMPGQAMPYPMLPTPPIPPYPRGWPNW